MAIHPRRKSDAARRANQIVRSRTVLVMLLLGIVTFAALFWRLYDLQIRQHAELQEKAISQQTHDLDHVQYSTLNRSLVPALEKAGLHVIYEHEACSEKQKEFVDQYFEDNVY